MLVMVLSVLWWGKSFAYFESKMYCQISKWNIVISLKSDDSNLCKKYITSLEVSMKKVYVDILSVQKYIDKKQDIWYWRPIKDQKVTLLNTLQSMRLNILSHMKMFEKNLFTKSKTYFLDSIVDYQKKLKHTLESLSVNSDSLSKKYVDLIKSQVAIIESIANSQTFEEMNSYMQRYIYLKQQIAWK